MLRSVRKPLVVLTPKSLLRSKTSTSKSAEFESGHFRETLDDPSITDRGAVKRVVICTGKIAYPLIEARDEAKKPVAIVRLEQLYPFPATQLDEIISDYPDAKEVMWVQDEPENMGGWTFIHSKLAAGGKMTDGRTLTHMARHESASPATGSQKIHEQEQGELVDKALSI